MFWFILCGLIALGVIIWAISDREPIILMLLVVPFILFLMLGMIYAGYMQNVNTFMLQSEYISNHVAKDSIENATLTNTKIELNEWLYSAQYFREHFRFFTFYPESILDLEPIQ